MSKLFRLAVVALAVGLLAQPSFAKDSAPVGDPVVAVVNGEKVYRSDVVRELQAIGPQAQQLPPQLLYPKLLEKVIVTRLVSAKGYEKKLQNTKEVKDRLKAAEDQLVADAYVHDVVQPKISEAKIKARYDELASKFKPEDEVRARHILVPTEKEADELLKKISDGTDFAKLAMENSKDTGSAKQGGDLGYFTRGTMVKPFAEAAFGMKVGEVSKKPVKTDFGYHIIKVEDRRKSSPPPLSEVKEQISSQVGQELVQELVKEMVNKAKIERFNIDGTPLKEASDK